MTLKDVSLGDKEKIVLDEYTRKPWRPEKLWKELASKRKMSRGTFYRCHRFLLGENPKRPLKRPLIYPLSDLEKINFGINEKGKFYYHMDESKGERWSMLLLKLKKYDGSQNLYHVSYLMKNDFSFHPGVTVSDIEDIINICAKLSLSDQNWSARGNFIDFIYSHVKRLISSDFKDGREEILNGLKQLFDKLSGELFGAEDGDDTQQAENVFKIICLFGAYEPLEIIKGLFMNVKEDKNGVFRPLLRSLIKYVDNLYSEETKRFFQTEVKAEDYFESEIDASLNNSEMFNLIRNKRMVIDEYLEKAKK